MFESILNSSSGTLSISNALICMVSSLLLGIIISYVHMLSNKYNKNFVITLALLPVLVQVVIMMVNGNLGTSVAILGAFGLIRFRSMPGTSRELMSIFFAMAVGLAVGMGYITYAISFTIITSICILLLTRTKFGERKNVHKLLRITIYENLDYSTIFDDIFKSYLKENTLEKVKTTNMGSMYELTYSIILKDSTKEKELLDEIRVKNGNLTVSINRLSYNENDL